MNRNVTAELRNRERHVEVVPHHRARPDTRCAEHPAIVAVVQTAAVRRERQRVMIGMRCQSVAAGRDIGPGRAAICRPVGGSPATTKMFELAGLTRITLL